MKKQSVLSVAPKSHPAEIAVARSQESGRFKKLPVFAIIPPALLVCACVGATAQRAVTARINGGAGEKVRFGKMSGGDARKLADAICTRVTGAPAQSLDASHQSAFSRRRGETVREWNVLCNTSAALYLVRINANTGRVYAINRMEAGGLDGAVALARLQGDDKTVSQSNADDSSTVDEASSSPEAAMLNKPAAEAQAQHYLRVAGVSAHGLHQVSESASCGAGQDKQWNFTYRRQVPGLGNRLVKVSVDGRNGQLTHMWNPVSAM